MKHSSRPAMAAGDDAGSRTAASALQASGISLCVAIGCLVLFLPPLLHTTVSSPARAALTGMAMSAALLLHWVLLAIAASRLQRSAVGWLSMSALLFPIGSVAALVLLSFFSDQNTGPLPAGQS